MTHAALTRTHVHQCVARGAGARWRCRRRCAWSDARIAAVGCEPQPVDLVVDLGGDRLLPGLINAHDHLQLNSFPPLELRATVSQRSGMDRGGQPARALGRRVPGRGRCAARPSSAARRREEPVERRHDRGPPRSAVPGAHRRGLSDPGGRALRLVALAGHRRRSAGASLVRTARRSTLALDHSRRGRRGCRGRRRTGPPRRARLPRREHVDRARRRARPQRTARRLADAGAGLIWCPASNLRLFGRSAEVADLVARGRVALGTRFQVERCARPAARVARGTRGLAAWTTPRCSRSSPSPAPACCVSRIAVLSKPGHSPISWCCRVRWRCPRRIAATSAWSSSAAACAMATWTTRARWRRRRSGSEVTVDGREQGARSRAGRPAVARRRARAWARICSRNCVEGSVTEALPAARARLKIVLYNPKAVFFTMPLALLAIGSALDPEKYEVVIVDGRLDADPIAALEPHLDDALCLGVTVLTGRADLGRAHGFARGQAAATRNCRSSGAAGTRRCSLASAWTSRRWTSASRARARRRSRKSSNASPRAAAWKAALAAPCALRTTGSCRTPRVRCGRSNQFRAHDYRLIPVERYFELKGRRQLDFITSQGCNFRCAFCSDPFVYGRKWVGLDPGVDRLAPRRTVAALPLRRRQFPGRDVFHAPRARAGDGRRDRRVRAASSRGRPPCAPTRASACPKRRGCGASSLACAGCSSAWNPARTRC